MEDKGTFSPALVNTFAADDMTAQSAQSWTAMALHLPNIQISAPEGFNISFFSLFIFLLSFYWNSYTISYQPNTKIFINYTFEIMKRFVVASFVTSK